MNLINQLFFAVLISSATSTVLFFVWWLLRGFFMIADAKLVYDTLRWICIMYILPIGYVAALITYRDGFWGHERAWKAVFTRTMQITDKLKIFAVLWFIMAACAIIYYIFDRLRLRRRLADNIPEEDAGIVGTYRSVCSRLGLQEEKLSLNRNVEIDMPCIISGIHPYLLLPERDYSEEELELIFFHELSHQKHKDLGFKSFAVIITLVHCFNPVSWVLLRKINFWSECMADLEALEASGNLEHAKTYFDNIADLIPDDKKKQVDSVFISTLCKSKKMFDRRVDFMKKYRLMKSAGKVVTTAAALAFVLMTGTTAYASGKTVADLHNVVYQDTENYTNVEGSTVRTVVAEDGMIEYHCKITDLDTEGLQIVTAPDEDIVSFAAGVHYNMDWYVGPNIRYISGDYYVSTSQTIYASTSVSPGSRVCDLGIMDDHGNAYYVRGSGALSHKFSIPESCRYRVFVQNNNSDVTLHATGYFFYENK